RAIWVPAGIEHSVYCSANTELRSLYIDSVVIPLHWPQCRMLAVGPLMRELIRGFSEMPVKYDEHGHEGRLVSVLLDQLALALKPVCRCRGRRIPGSGQYAMTFRNIPTVEAPCWNLVSV
ncbi:cupin domain-containing protein, partial [Caballeronia glebae]